jgi:outer membrane murein-binding lipoprotein Lpp
MKQEVERPLEARERYGVLGASRRGDGGRLGHEGRPITPRTRLRQGRGFGTDDVPSIAVPFLRLDDRSPSSAVVERFTAVRCAHADVRGEHAAYVGKLPPLGCVLAALVRENAAVGSFDADDVWELAADVRELAADVRELATDVGELAPDVRELAAVVRELAAVVWELAAVVKFLAHDGGKRVPRRWELAFRRWELPYSRCELPHARSQDPDDGCEAADVVCEPLHDAYLHAPSSQRPLHDVCALPAVG